jgi:prepilin-type N-terminal cleavage/methylation domain-containing protein
MAHSGFTLVELLVSILLTSIIMGAVYSVYRVQTHTVKIQENRLEAQEYARSVLDLMVREIRNAGYNPLGVTNGANCSGGSSGAPSVVSAAATSFRFTYDYRGANSTDPPDGDCGDADEDIIYASDSTGCTGVLVNITRNGNSNPLTECNVTNLDIRYFKQDGTELSRPVAAADLPNIQRVLITLTVQSKNPDAEFGGQQLNATLTSNVDLRNRGLPS